MTTAKTLCVLIHGFSISDAKSFWGRIPYFLQHDAVRKIDTLVAQYTTSKALYIDLISTSLGSLRMPTSERIARQILSSIRLRCREANYEAVLLIGHSYGGLIATLSCQSKDRFTVPIRGVCLCASPGKQNLFATLHVIGGGGNAQTRELAGRKIYRKVYQKLVPKLSRDIPFWYLEATNEEVVREPTLDIFTQNWSHPGVHSWPREVENRNHMGYRYLLEFVNSYAI